MVFDTHYSRLKRRAAIGAIACAIIGYFAFHAFHGEHGIIASERYEARVKTLHKEVAELQARRQSLERRISLLSAESLDPDMLEEQARKTLNLAHPRDVVILNR